MMQLHSPLKNNAFIPSALIQRFSQIPQCYISSQMHCVSSGIQDQILFLLDSFPSLDECEKKWKSNNS